MAYKNKYFKCDTFSSSIITKLQFIYRNIVLSFWARKKIPKENWKLSSAADDYIVM